MDNTFSEIINKITYLKVIRKYFINKYIFELKNNKYITKYLLCFRIWKIGLLYYSNIFVYTP